MDTANAPTGTVAAEAAIRRDRARTWRIWAVAALLVVTCVLPFVMGDYRVFQFTLAFTYALALLGLNLLIGFNGQFSLGHGAFYAIGAYTAAVMIHQWGIHYGWTLVAAGIVCGVAGFLFGIPALRIQGMYLALATLALALAMPPLLKYKAWEAYTGGVQGIFINKPHAPFGLPLNPDEWLYFLSLGVLLIAVVVAHNLLNGRTGRAMMAIRDNPIAAEAMGINTALYKSLTFGVSALFTGVAGALSCIVVQFVAPDSYSVFLSITLLVGSVVGGLASISGAIYGAFFIQFIPNVADAISKAAPWAIYGLFLIGFMFVMPGGIAGFMNMVWSRLQRQLPLARRRGAEAGHTGRTNSKT
ncbi:MAG TPA: branched-chain amino acid ABC transporter permease [bacterium]|nr:branched-chain amino acid ABC transporter permease [bacterium]